MNKYSVPFVVIIKLVIIALTHIRIQIWTATKKTLVRKKQQQTNMTEEKRWGSNISKYLHRSFTVYKVSIPGISRDSRHSSADGGLWWFPLDTYPWIH